MKEKFMQIAIKEAKIALLENEVPVGCVIVKNNKVISKAHNTKNNTNNCINHAEMIAITKASIVLNNWRLNDCDIYITLFPCPMCASAIHQSRIKKIYYCEFNQNIKIKSIVEKILESDNINPSNLIEKLDNSSEFLKNFFKEKRK